MLTVRILLLLAVFSWGTQWTIAEGDDAVMSGQGKERTVAFAEVAIKVAAEGLAANTFEGRTKAYYAIIEALNLAESEGYDGHSAKLFQYLGDMYLQAGDTETALSAYSDAVLSPGGLGDPEIHLRLGKIFYDRGDQPKAGDEFARALIMGGKKIFDDQPEEYFRFVTSILLPPPEGWDNYVPPNNQD
ncbi:MAG: tetratricopeptide repeat protein [Acidobacteria bacterium]|nr:tetratricopeptide repeat protein [Acidobacteriota bacterium]